MLIDVPISKVNVSKCAKLKTLDLGGTQVSSVDVSSVLGLESLYLSGNRIRSVDVSANAELRGLLITEDIAHLDISGNAKLEDLEVNAPNLDAESRAAIEAWHEAHDVPGAYDGED